jgi:hypothetical protein
MMNKRKPALRFHKIHSQQVRLVPIWHKTLDRDKLARALARIALSATQLDKPAGNSKHNVADSEDSAPSASGDKL